MTRSPYDLLIKKNPVCVATQAGFFDLFYFGNLTVMVVPLPTVLSREILALWILAECLSLIHISATEMIKGTARSMGIVIED